VGKARVRPPNLILNCGTAAKWYRKMPAPPKRRFAGLVPSGRDLPALDPTDGQWTWNLTSGDT
jgi:hypothetical protein